MSENDAVEGSFRDRSGFVFVRDGHICRQVNHRYKELFDRLIDSGLYETLAGRGLLIRHEVTGGESGEAYKILRPEQIPFVSYPYEWCFEQLKRAALATLEIQRTAVDFGLSLKDASAFNIQFKGPQAVLIDTLSFEIYKETSPWTAYRQFCQHFLAPLLLLAYVDVRLNLLSRVFIDGIPLDLASRLLPKRTYIRLGALLHIHLHARYQKKFDGATSLEPGSGYSRLKHLALLDSLSSVITSLECREGRSVWSGYADAPPSYTGRAFDQKKSIVSGFLDRIAPKKVWDLGANTGAFSRIASVKGSFVVSFDSDPWCVEELYRRCASEGETNILPLVLDLTNPSPGIGWRGEERSPIIGRDAPDVVMALGLLHHLALGNNLPFDRISRFFRDAGRYLIIEFVPLSDPFARRMLLGKEDLIEEYNEDGFTKAFSGYFDVLEAIALAESDRKLFLMRRREGSAA